MAFYLVERYVPSMDDRDVERATRRLRGARPGVRHLCTVFLPDEETCLSVFEGPDAATVEVANTEAEFPLDRIVEASVFMRSDGGAR